MTGAIGATVPGVRVVFEEPADQRPVVVARFVTPIEATIARGALEREGIESELRDDALVGIAWHLSNAVGGVKLVVRPADAEAARALLAELHQDRADAAEVDGSEPQDPEVMLVALEEDARPAAASPRTAFAVATLAALLGVLALIRWR